MCANDRIINSDIKRAGELTSENVMFFLATADERFYPPNLRTYLPTSLHTYIHNLHTYILTTLTWVFLAMFVLILGTHAVDLPT